ncbi:NfeD family protein [Sphingomonas mucosissima]|uniref:Inner membrane protein YbbJ n=1 Tax=Sphingomonas mucosissima TaxID=370959 RepID=A0A245ZSM6_9SPHN|nr:NfeD family protein [Sphingomonas mucosissima]OWK32754.1 inner membrane protein YbbJ [Sphingomonas mucosissima]
MHPSILWLLVAVVLAAAELAVPGVFLVFLGVAAAIVSAATFVLPDLPIAAQLGAFAMWSVVAVLIGRRWYEEYPVETSDPLLNDRARRLVGETVTVANPIVGGHGRVRVGDGEWPATGPDAALGARMRIISVDNGILIVEPV